MKEPFIRLTTMDGRSVERALADVSREPREIDNSEIVTGEIEYGESRLRWSYPKWLEFLNITF